MKKTPADNIAERIKVDYRHLVATRQCSYFESFVQNSAAIDDKFIDLGQIALALQQEAASVLKSSSEFDSPFGGSFTPEQTTQLVNGVGNILWHCARLLQSVNLGLTDAMELNMIEALSVIEGDKDV